MEIKLKNPHTYTAVAGEAKCWSVVNPTNDLTLGTITRYYTPKGRKLYSAHISIITMGSIPGISLKNCEDMDEAKELFRSNLRIALKHIRA